MPANLLSPLSRLYKIGRGQCLFSPFDTSNAFTGSFYHLGNVKSFQYTNKPTVEKQFSSLGGPSTLSDIGVSMIDGEVTIKGTEFSSLNLSLVYGGTQMELAQDVDSSITAAPVTSDLVLGSYYSLGYRNVTITDLKIGSTALVNNTTSPPGDYNVIDPLAGTVQILQNPYTSGTVVAGATVTWDGSAAAIPALDQVALATQNIIGGSFLFLPNNARGINQEVRIWNILFTPDNGPDWLSDKYGEFTIKGSVIDDWVSSAGSHGGTAALPVGYVLDQTAS